MAFQYNNSTAPLPQGFSIYQPQLGAQLQFFPALGTQELDDMMNAYLPGTAAIKEKRKTVSLDFLEHSRLTGQNFKFYPIFSLSPAAASPATSSSSSFNVSPINPTWDWNMATGPASSTSSLSSHKQRKSSKASTSSSRHPTTDFSHLPGMKIMTKDGQDVTNSAARGTKTKEQRAHAHLMRIIKACDSCKRKKIRCDPSHKKRQAPKTQPQTAAKAAKKAHASPQKPSTATTPILDDALSISQSPLGLDSDFVFTDLEGMDVTDEAAEYWEQFLQYPAAGADENYDFFFDPEGHLSSQSSASSTSASPGKALTPPSQQESHVAAIGVIPQELSSQYISPQLPFLDDPSSTNSYTDFNLFSPGSSFSEDEHMVVMSSRQISPSQQSISEEYPTSVYNSLHSDRDVISWSDISASVSPLDPMAPMDLGGAYEALEWYNPGTSLGQSSRRGLPAGNPGIPGVIDPVGEVEIAFAPSDTVIVAAQSMSIGRTVDDVSTQTSDIPGSASIAVFGGSETPVQASPGSTANSVPFGGDTQVSEIHQTLPATARFGREWPVQDTTQSLPDQTGDGVQPSPAGCDSQSTMEAISSGPTEYSPGSDESRVVVSAQRHEQARIDTACEVTYALRGDANPTHSVAQIQDTGVSPIGLAATSSMSEQATTVASPTETLASSHQSNNAQWQSPATGTVFVQEATSSSTLSELQTFKVDDALPIWDGSAASQHFQSLEMFVEATTPLSLASYAARVSSVAAVLAMISLFVICIGVVGPRLVFWAASLMLALRTTTAPLAAAAMAVSVSSVKSLGGASVFSSASLCEMTSQGKSFSQKHQRSSVASQLSTLRQVVSRRLSPLGGGRTSPSILASIMG